MNKEAKIVARTRKGEVIKGYINSEDLEKLSRNESVYLRFKDPGNTIGTYICQNQLEGLFVVRTFEGKKPGLMIRLYHDVKRFAKDNTPLITASVTIASLSMVGLIALF